MQKKTWIGILRVVVRLVLGGTFVVASLHKIGDPAAFAKIIYGYKLAPGFLINLAAVILPWVELFTGALLILGLFRRGACLIINAMLVFFMVAISFNIARGLEFDCGCFSFSESGGPWEVLVRDAVLLAAGLWLFFSMPEKKSSPSARQKALPNS